MGKKINVYRSLVGKSKGKRPLERPKRKWMDSVKIGREEIGWSSMNWIGLPQDSDRAGLL
jgi:hypothetical protein